jgi:hypothetical protein
LRCWAGLGYLLFVCCRATQFRRPRLTPDGGVFYDGAHGALSPQLCGGTHAAALTGLLAHLFALLGQ